MNNFILSLIFTLYSISSYSVTEQIIYLDQNGNTLSQRLQTDDSILGDGFENFCFIIPQTQPCNEYGGGGINNVYSCQNYNQDQLLIQYPNEPEAVLEYKSSTIYTCDGIIITSVTMKEKSCYALPGGGGSSGIHTQIFTSHYVCN